MINTILRTAKKEKSILKTKPILTTLISEA